MYGAGVAPYRLDQGHLLAKGVHGRFRNAVKSTLRACPITRKTRNLSS